MRKTICGTPGFGTGLRGAGGVVTAPIGPPMLDDGDRPSRAERIRRRRKAKREMQKQPMTMGEFIPWIVATFSVLGGLGALFFLK